MTVRARIDRDTRATEIVNFGAFDSKGRAVGARVTFAGGVCAARSAGVGAIWPAPPGAEVGAPAFAMEVRSTRNGVDFGPAQSWRVFATAEAREAAKTKYLDRARRRAAIRT